MNRDIVSNDPYEDCPTFETDRFLLRLIHKQDTEQLINCYGDRNAVHYMNADNCNNDFYYPTMEEMQEAVDFWIESYKNRWFIRMTILDKRTEKAIGTIEVFAGNCGVLRVDVAEGYERMDYLSELFQLAVDEFFTMMDNEKMVTKAIPEAVERRKALDKCGWTYIDSFRTYKDYYLLERKQIY